MALTITDRGEAYITIEKIVAARPQRIFLLFPWRAKRETKTTTANILRTETRSPKIFAFSFLGANIRKINTYIDSIAAPVPLMIETNMLFGDTKGKPYLIN